MTSSESNSWVTKFPFLQAKMNTPIVQSLPWACPKPWELKSLILPCSIHLFSRSCCFSKPNIDWSLTLELLLNSNFFLPVYILFFKKNIYLLGCALIVMWVAAYLNCGIQYIVPWPGIEPKPPALGAQSLSHWTTREVLTCIHSWSSAPASTMV